MSEESNYLRTAYESYSSAGWFVVLITSIVIMAQGNLPKGPFYYIVGLSFIAWSSRTFKTLQVWRYRAALSGKAVEIITPEMVQKKMDARPGHLWIGKGFQWERIHMQRLYELEKLSTRDKRKLRPPLLFRSSGKPKKGVPELHGVEPDEHDIYVPIKDVEGHIFVPAQTGAIKTRMLSLFVSQAIRRTPKESVIVMDPKYDPEMAALVEHECKAVGREDDYAFFHPAFPEKSVRLDCLKTWSRTTEVASRIQQALMQADGNLDPWSAFAWRMTNITAEGLIHGMREYPSIKSLRRYLEGGIDQLLHMTLISVFEDRGIDWREAIKPYMNNVTRMRKPDPSTPDETIALMLFYNAEVQPKESIGYVNGLISMFTHDRDHYSKMINNLLPSLTMLTAGELEGLMSPDRSDVNDHRPILDASKIIDGGMVLYMGLDTLSDMTIGNSIGSIFLADATAVAGRRAVNERALPKANIFIDEANQVANPSMIELMNKSRSAGFTLYLFSQLVADFIVKLGKKELARQVLGNANTTLAGRSTDKETIELVTENFGRSILKSKQVQHMTSPIVSGVDVANYTGAYGMRTAESLSEIVPPEALTRLPDLEYFGTISGGLIVKGRIPVITLNNRK